MFCGEFLLKADLTPLIVQGVLAHFLGQMALKPTRALLSSSAYSLTFGYCF